MTEAWQVRELAWREEELAEQLVKHPQLEIAWVGNQSGNLWVGAEGVAWCGDQSCAPHEVPSEDQAVYVPIMLPRWR